ncbi:A disintegrin and metalloproteinase with thrombospondin motifs 16, partial [Armadillidium nasatum]
SDYNVVNIRTRKREVRSTESVTLNPGHLDLTVEDSSGKYDVEIHPNNELLSPHFKLVVRGEDGNIEEEVEGRPFKQCLYTGSAKGKEHSSAVALSTCDGRGFTGVIIDGDETHLIRPAKNRMNRLKRNINDEVSDEMTHDGLHIIHTKQSTSKCAIKNLRAMMAPEIFVRLPEGEEPSNFWETFLFDNESVASESESETERRHSVHKRQATNKKYQIETAVFTDGAMYEFIKNKEGGDSPVVELENVVLTIMNGVNIIYNAPSMRTRISVVMIRLEIMKSTENLIDDADGDIAVYLSNFCSWQQKQNAKLNPKGDSAEGFWDHGLLLSGVDLWDVDPSKNKVIGLAWVGGMCNAFYSCTINEGTSFEAQFVIAHEIGHNLNLSHDGSAIDGNTCPSDKYLMSPSTGPGKLSWSVCSNRELEKFLTVSPNVGCLSDAKREVRTFGSEGDEKYPGEIYNIQDQCEYALGETFSPYVTSKDPYDAVCRELWCQNRTHAMRTHPALEGSACERDKHCIGGACVKKMKNPNSKKVPSIPNDSENEIPDSKTPEWEPERGHETRSHFGLKDLFKRIRNLFNKYLLYSRDTEVKMLAEWQLVDLTYCSEPCGGGWQTGVVKCVRLT